MATISYVGGGDWWSAARMNELFAEFDRRLSVALAGKTPYLLVGYGGVAGHGFGGNLPVAYAAPAVTGFGAPTGPQVAAVPGPAFGTVYCFKGGDAPIVYFRYTNGWNQGGFDAWMDGLAEVSRDPVTQTMRVAATAHPAYRFDQSLRVRSRTDAGVSYVLWENHGTPDRALRWHDYAVAEIVCEGLETFTLPLAWDRYPCFRLHNLSGLELVVTVETDAGDKTVTVPPFGCRALRRAPGYYDDSLNYHFRYRAGIDKRFYRPLSAGFPEWSAAAGNLMRPQVILDWVSVLNGGELDPAVAPPDNLEVRGLFGDPTVPGTPVGDLLAHRGEIRAVGWVLPPVNNEVRVGRFNGHATMVADFAPLGVTVTVAAGVITLARAAAGAPGEPGSGLDLLAPGTNLLWCPAQTVAAPGSPSGLVPERVRQYTPLPVTLIGGVDINAGPLFFNQTLSGTNPVGANPGGGPLLGNAQSPVTPWEVDSPDVGGGSPIFNFGRISTVSDAKLAIAGPDGVDLSPWRLTPEGWQLVATHTYTIRYAYYHETIASLASMWELGLYDSASGPAMTRRTRLTLPTPGWPTLFQPHSMSPGYERRFGRLLAAATKDWTGIQATLAHGEPVATGKVFEDTPSGLRYLGNPGAPDTTVDAAVAGRYGLFMENDETRSAMTQLRSDWRVRFAQGTPYPESGGTQFFWRRPMQAEDFNHLAWAVNAWTRTAPVMDISQVWLHWPAVWGNWEPTHVRTDCGINGMQPGGGVIRSGIWPARSYLQIGDPAHVPIYQAMGLTVSTAADAPGWAAANAVVGKGSTWLTQYRAADENVVAVITSAIPPSGSDPVGQLSWYYTWDRVYRNQGITRGSLIWLQNWDYNLYASTGIAQDPPPYLTIDTVQALAARLGMPCHWISSGVALKLVVRPGGAPTWKTTPVPRDALLSAEVFYFYDAGPIGGGPGVPPPRVPDPPTLQGSGVAAEEWFIRFEPAESEADVEWFGDNVTLYRWGGSSSIWNTVGRQRYEDAFVVGGVNQDTAATTFTRPEEVRDRDAEVRQVVGCLIAGPAGNASFLRGGAWWADYAVDAVNMRESPRPPIPNTPFVTNGGGGAPLVTGMNLATASPSTAYAVRVVGGVALDLT